MPAKTSNGSRVLPNGEEFNSAAWKEAKKRARASLEPYCVICGGLIDMEGQPFLPNSCEVDHIIPISRYGPPYELSNLQLSHSKCNRRKGNKMDGDYPSNDNKNPVPLSNNW